MRDENKTWLTAGIVLLLWLFFILGLIWLTGGNTQ